MDKTEQIIELYKQWANCELCPLHNPTGRQRKNVVFGTGNVGASILIVLDEPSESDDESGNPLSSSGEVLKHLCDFVGLSIPDLFITNIVGCWPTQEHNAQAMRPLKVSEAKPCVSRVEQIINIVDPKVVVLMGGLSYKLLSPDKLPYTNVVSSRSPVDVRVETRGVFKPVSRIAYATHRPTYLAENWTNAPGGVVHQAVNVLKKAKSTVQTIEEVCLGIPYREDS